MIIAQKTRDIHNIPHAAKTQSQLDPQAICNRPGEEAHGAKRAVEGDSRIIGSRSIELASTSEATDGVEHARTHEADKGNKSELDRGRRIMRDRDGPDTTRGVFPATVVCGDEFIICSCWGARRIFGVVGIDDMGLGGRRIFLWVCGRHSERAGKEEGRRMSRQDCARRRAAAGVSEMKEKTSDAKGKWNRGNEGKDGETPVV